MRLNSSLVTILDLFLTVQENATSSHHYLASRAVSRVRKHQHSCGRQRQHCPRSRSRPPQIRHPLPYLGRRRSFLSRHARRQRTRYAKTWLQQTERQLHPSQKRRLRLHLDRHLVYRQNQLSRVIRGNKLNVPLIQEFCCVFCILIRCHWK